MAASVKFQRFGSFPQIFWSSFLKIMWNNKKWLKKISKHINPFELWIFQDKREFSDFPAFHDFSNFFWQQNCIQGEIWRRIHMFGFFFWSIFWCFTWFLKNLTKKFEENCQNFEISRKPTYSIYKLGKSLYFILTNMCAKFQLNRNTPSEDDCRFGVKLP